MQRVYLIGIRMKKINRLKRKMSISSYLRRIDIFYEINIVFFSNGRTA